MRKYETKGPVMAYIYIHLAPLDGENHMRI